MINIVNDQLTLFVTWWRLTLQQKGYLPMHKIIERYTKICRKRISRCIMTVKIRVRWNASGANLPTHIMQCQKILAISDVVHTMSGVVNSRRYPCGVGMSRISRRCMCASVDPLFLKKNVPLISFTPMKTSLLLKFYY